MGDPSSDARHAERMVASLKCQGEVMGYWREAKRRGVSAHELTFLSRAKAQLKKSKKWNDRWQSLEVK